MKVGLNSLEDFGHFIRLCPDQHPNICVMAWVALAKIFRQVHLIDERLANGENWEFYSADEAEKRDLRLEAKRDKLIERATEIAGQFGFDVYHSGDPRGIPHLTKSIDGRSFDLFPYLPY